MKVNTRAINLGFRLSLLQRVMAVDYAKAIRTDTVLIRDEELFNRKVAKIVSDGLTDLQCVFDFDATISKAFHNGQPASSCHRALEEILPAEVKEHMDMLNKKFMKIEFDPLLTKVEKQPHMVEWWSTAHSRMIEAKITKTQLDDAVKASGIILREREAEFFASLKARDVPILLFSAGITQIVQAAMKHKSTAGLTDNMDVISNEMIFDEQDTLSDFSTPLIHTFSKTTASIGEEWKQKLNERENVILMGDSHGDPDMVKDEDLQSGECLRVGFLNRNPEKNLESYKAAYDVVLVSDETLNVPIALFNIFMGSNNNLGNTCS